MSAEERFALDEVIIGLTDTLRSSQGLTSYEGHPRSRDYILTDLEDDFHALGTLLDEMKNRHHIDTNSTPEE